MRLDAHTIQSAQQINLFKESENFTHSYNYRTSRIASHLHIKNAGFVTNIPVLKRINDFSIEIVHC